MARCGAVQSLAILPMRPAGGSAHSSACAIAAGRAGRRQRVQQVGHGVFALVLRPLASPKPVALLRAAAWTICTDMHAGSLSTARACSTGRPETRADV